MTDTDTNLDHLLDSLLVTLGEECHGLRRPHGRVQQPLPVRILTNLFQNLTIIRGQGRQEFISIDLLLVHRSINITEKYGCMMLFSVRTDDPPVPAVLVGRGAVPDVGLQVTVVGVALVTGHHPPPVP